MQFVFLMSVVTAHQDIYWETVMLQNSVVRLKCNVTSSTTFKISKKYIEIILYILHHIGSLIHYQHIHCRHSPLQHHIMTF